MPAGGSCCNLLKSLINLFLAGVDILTAYKSNPNKHHTQQIVINPKHKSQKATIKQNCSTLQFMEESFLKHIVLN